MALRAPTPIRGLVASLRGPLPTIAREVLQAAWRHGIDLRTIDIGLLRNIVPAVLDRESEAWIVLYTEAKSTDLLLVPYIAEDLGYDGEWPSDSLRQIDHFFASIRPDRNATWTVASGYRSLAAAGDKGLLLPAANRFQAFRLPEELRQLFRGAIPRGGTRIADSWFNDIDGWLNEASRKIASQRRILRATLADSTDSVRADEARESFDSYVLDEATQIAERAANCELVNQPPLLSLMRFGEPFHGLDPDSEQFLRTALIVEEVGVQQPFGSFDFAAAACPLCKIVERELNLSVGWLVRMLRNVASHESPWFARADVDPHKHVEIPTNPPPGRTVDINIRVPAGGPRLKGLMLGALQHLLSSGRSNGLQEDILGQSLGNEWPPDQVDRFLFGRTKRSKEAIHHTIAKLLALRNPHAHDTAMSRSDYDKIKKTILGTFDTPANSLVARIISFKSAISTVATSGRSLGA